MIMTCDCDTHFTMSQARLSPRFSQGSAPASTRTEPLGKEDRETLSVRGFQLLAFKQMPKEMEFGAWAERMRCSRETTANFKNAAFEGRLLKGSPLSRFLKPRTDENGTLHFTLQEALLVAQKPAA